MLALISEIVNFGIVNKLPSDTIAKAIIEKLKEYNYSATVTMSQSMLEKVAKAMANAVAMNYDHNEVIFKVYAKAALEAMREPTNDMANEYYKLSYKTEVFVVATWQRSIDAIINEK